MDIGSVVRVKHNTSLYFSGDKGKIVEISASEALILVKLETSHIPLWFNINELEEDIK
jgi:hypothetical protein